MRRRSALTAWAPHKSEPGLFDMAFKNLGFLGFFLNKNLMSDLSFYAFFTYYATNLIEMLSYFPINMNCIFCVHMAESLQSALHTYIFICGTV